MQKTVFPAPHHQFERNKAHLGKLHPSTKTNNASGNMAQLRSAPKPATTTFSFVQGGGGGAFGNSKFFLKRQNRAASKIQALVRAFLVQARLYRQRVLEPRLQELRDCEARKAEELRRIQELFQQEYNELPALMKKEAEASAEEADVLRADIEAYKKANECLKQERKEVKQKNKELQRESLDLKEKDFKLAVSNQKIAKENEELQSTLERYQFATEDGNSQRDDLEGALMKCIYQQQVMKRYIAKIIKKVEIWANTGASGGGASPPASPRRKSLSKKDGSSPPTSPKPRRKSVKEASPPSSPKQQHSKRKSGKKTSKGRSSIKGQMGDAAFNWATMSNSALDVDLDMSLDQHLEDQPEDQACFDWATKSYNWANQSLALDNVLEEEKPTKSHRRHSIGNHHDVKPPRRPSKMKQPIEEEPGQRRERRRSSKHKVIPADHDIVAARELVHELKLLKKQAAKL